MLASGESGDSAFCFFLNVFHCLLFTGLCPTSGLVRLFSVGFYLEESSLKGIS